MKRYKLSDMSKGWFIGDFEPSILKTSAFEVAVKHHRGGEYYEAHFQLVATEYNVVVTGAIQIGEEVFFSGDIFVVEPNEVVKPVFLENSTVVVVKVPSLPDDKVVAE